MTKLELLQMLEKQAREFRIDRGSFKRNAHMLKIDYAPLPDEVDAVLVGFINYVGICQGIDYALYASDLAKPLPDNPPH